MTSRCSFARSAAALVARGLAVGATRAHDMWLAPDRFTPAAGEPLRVRLFLGDGDRVEERVRDLRRVVRFVALAPEGGEDSGQPIAGMDGLAPAGFMRPAKAGTWILAYESDPSAIALSPDRFRAYAVEKGVDEAAAAVGRAGPDVTEEFSRSLKSLVSVGGAPPVDRVVGLPFELVLDRWTGRTDRLTRIRLLLHGHPVSNVLVRGRSLDGRDAAMDSRTDAEGCASLDLAAGDWLLTAVHLVRTEDGPAEWRSLWTSLTFSVPRRVAPAPVEDGERAPRGRASPEARAVSADHGREQPSGSGYSHQATGRR